MYQFSNILTLEAREAKKHDRQQLEVEANREDIDKLKQGLFELKLKLE